MKVKEWLEAFEELDPNIDLMIFIPDPKRPNLGTGWLKPIKDIEITETIDQDTNKTKYALKLQEGGEEKC